MKKELQDFVAKYSFELDQSSTASSCSEMLDISEFYVQTTTSKVQKFPNLFRKDITFVPMTEIDS